MPKIDISAKKWDRKMERAGPIWKAHVTDKSEAYRKGLETFMGESVNPLRVEAWKAGVDAVSAEDFAEAVRGKGAKWKRRFIEAMAA